MIEKFDSISKDLLYGFWPCLFIGHTDRKLREGEERKAGITSELKLPNLTAQVSKFISNRGTALKLCLRESEFLLT